MPARTFRSPTGSRWVVWSVRPDRAEDASMRSVTVAPPLRDGWLCFESDRDKRRLFPIPDGWYFVTDERLWELCEAADHVGRPPVSSALDR